MSLVNIFWAKSNAIALHLDTKSVNFFVDIFWAKGNAIALHFDTKSVNFVGEYILGKK